MTEIQLVEWRHSRHGRIQEIVCERHSAELVHALSAATP